jgi:hypothetical protein
MCTGGYRLKVCWQFADLNLTKSCRGLAEHMQAPSHKLLHVDTRPVEKGNKKIDKIGVKWVTEGKKVRNLQGASRQYMVLLILSQRKDHIDPLKPNDRGRSIARPEGETIAHSL